VTTFETPQGASHVGAGTTIEPADADPGAGAEACREDPERQAWHTHAAQAFYARGFTIAAGTSEVQRNVLARALLRDPAAAGAGDEAGFAALAQALDHALPRLLAQAPGHAAAAALARAGWWWPPADGLPLPRPAVVVLLGLALGRQGVALAYPAAVAAAAALEGLPGEPAAQALAGLAAGDPGCVLVGPAWQAVQHPEAGQPAGAIGAGAPDAPARTQTQTQAAATRLRGRATPLPWTPGAQALLVRTGDGAGDTAAWLLPLTTPGLRARSAPGPDGLPLADIEGDVGLPATAHPLARGPGVGTAWAQAAALATLAACAQAVGQMQALVAATARHAQTRRQFAQPLAQFQAVQHRLVDMHVATEETRALLHATARRLAAGTDAAAVAALALKATQAGRAVGQGAVQLHGAYAMTAESGIGTRVIALEAVLARHAGALAHAEVLAGLLLADAGAGEGA
jgi:alkylation response protein AidB-like acyl-CoA dehydrogenase